LQVLLEHLRLYLSLVSIHNIRLTLNLILSHGIIKNRDLKVLLMLFSSFKSYNVIVTHKIKIFMQHILVRVQQLKELSYQDILNWRKQLRHNYIRVMFAFIILLLFCLLGDFGIVWLLTKIVGNYWTHFLLSLFYGRTCIWVYLTRYIYVLYMRCVKVFTVIKEIFWSRRAVSRLFQLIFSFIGWHLIVILEILLHLPLEL